MKNQVEWQLVTSVGRKKKKGKRAVSYSPKALPADKELVTIAYGRTLKDIAGIKREVFSFWAIDESGSVVRTEASMGRAITYSAVTQLSEVDYQRLFDGITKTVDKKGRSEIHYRELRENHPDELKKVVDQISNAPFLVLSLPELKTEIDTRTSWDNPKNALYVLGAIDRLVKEIDVVDLSETIIVMFDRTDEITDAFIDVLWTEKITVRMEESYLSKLLQVADLAASVTGNAINYPGELNEELFWRLYRISENMSARDSVTTASKPDGTDRIASSKNYKKKTLSRRSILKRLKRSIMRGDK